MIFCSKRPGLLHHWSMWVKQKADFARTRRLGDDLLYDQNVTVIRFTQVWQERSCKKCGIIQQKDLRQ